MDSIAGRLIYKIVGENGGLIRSLDNSKRSMIGLGKTAQSTGAMIQRYLAGGAMVLLGKKLVSLSSDTAELGNKFQVVFKGAIETTNDWIEEYTEAVGRGDLATREYLTSLQDIRTGFGAPIKEAAKFSRAVVGVTNDLSSFSNVGFEETSAAIQSGLSGQFEALRRLGVGLNVAIINEGKYAKTLKKTWDEMDNLERQEAILSGIMSQSANALGQTVENWKDYNYELGDAARTSDGFANQSKAMTQELQDLGAAFGDELMPYATMAVEAGRDLIEWMDDMTPAAKQATIAVAGLSAAFMAGGGVGALISIVGMAALKVADMRDRRDELVEVTDRLTRSSKEYREVVEKLDGDLSKMSEAEVKILKLRKEQLAIQTKNALAEYAIEQERFKAQQGREKSRLEELEARKKAHEDVLDDAQKAEAELDELERKQARLTASGLDMERAELNRLNALTEAISNNTKKWFGENAGVNKANLKILELKKEINSQEKEGLDLEIQRQEAVTSAARLYADGLIDISRYKETNRELYDEIVKASEALKIKNKIQDNASRILEKYKNEVSGVKDLNEEILESIKARAIAEAGANKDAIQMLNNYFADVRRGLKESATELKSWREQLSEILGSSDEFKGSGADAARKFLEGLDREIQAEKTIHKSLNGNLDKWDPLPSLKQKANEIRSAMSQMLSIDPSEIDEAFTSTDGSVQVLLDSLRAVEGEIKKVAKAQEEAAELKKGEAFSRNIIEEYTEKIQELGDAEKTRIDIAREQAVVKAKENGATEEAIALINEYYDAVEEEEKKAQNAEKWKKWTRDGLNAVQQITSALAQMNNQLLKNQLAAIEAQMNAELKAMGLLEDEKENRYSKEKETAQKELKDLQEKSKKETDIEKKKELLKAAQEKAVEVDKLITKEANENKKMAIEEKYARKKAQLEYKMALQNWEMQMIGMVASGAQAVMNAWATSGNIYASIALAAVAATVSTIQMATLAAAKPQPPSFDVGAWEIPEDMNANIHRGEMILPAPFAESVRSGEAVIGAGGAANVNIEIYTSEPVDAEEEKGAGGDLEKIRLFVGRAWIEKYRSGGFDSALFDRHGLKKRGLS